MRYIPHFLRRVFGTNPIGLGSTSILLWLTVQITGIFLLGLVGVNLWMMVQMNQQMSNSAPMKASVVWHIGMHSLMAASIVAMPMVIGAIVFTVWRSLLPLQQLTNSISVQPLKPSSQPVLPAAQMPAEVRSLAETYENLASALTEIGDQQQQFISGLSHELRTSLSLVSGYLQQILRRNTNLTATQQEALKIAATETERMVQLLQDSLDLARAESHSLPLHLEPLVLNQVVADAVRMVDKFSHHKILVEATATSITVKADRDRLLQVLMHLIDNGIRHCNEQYPITLKLDQTSHSAIIQVTDNGVGIAIPQQFHQPIDLSTARSTGGTGIGLAIVDTLVKRMGGNVSVQSSPGAGSHFWVTLPAR